MIAGWHFQPPTLVPEINGQGTGCWTTPAATGLHPAFFHSCLDNRF